ncbi:MAG: iron-sulfur cluster repair di-iron protein [Clostridiaceae bacterium]|nr:iron-sulfur cluster repair di-iron protein [Clostridiaceae bacterium]
MKTKIYSTDTIGDTASVFPGAMDIFLKYNIDFCCGGNRPLIEAIEEQKLNERVIMEEINEKYEEFIHDKKDLQDFTKYTSHELIDHIVDTHHEYLRNELPQLSKLTAKIFQVHGPTHPELLRKVDALFHGLKDELEQHLVKEEEVLFPLVKAYEKENHVEEKTKILNTIKELEDEHEAAGTLLKELRSITDGYTVPEDVCKTVEFTYRKLEELELDLFQHIHLENNILFKFLNS